MERGTLPIPFLGELLGLDVFLQTGERHRVARALALGCDRGA